MDDNPLKDLPDFDFEVTDEADTAPPADPSGAAVPPSADSQLLDMELDIEALEADAAEEMSALAREIKEFFVAFVKTLRASALYVQGNPLLHQFVDDLTARLTKLWGVVESVSFTIHENEIMWHEHVVYKGRVGGHENLAFQLYKDGIRRVDFQPGVEEHELRQFMDVLRLSRTLQSEQEDLLKAREGDSLIVQGPVRHTQCLTNLLETRRLSLVEKRRCTAGDIQTGNLRQ